MEELTYFQKDGRNTFQKYNYVSEAKAKEQFRACLIKHKITMIPQDITDINVFNIGDKVHFTAKYHYNLTDAESGEVETVVSIGSGVDNGDKHSYKASAGAMKYAIMQLLLTPTGDDPEVPREDEKQTTAPKSVSAPKEPETTNGEDAKVCEACNGRMEYKPGGVTTIDGQKKRYPAHYACTSCSAKSKA